MHEPFTVYCTLSVYLLCKYGVPLSLKISMLPIKYPKINRQTIHQYFVTRMVQNSHYLLHSISPFDSWYWHNHTITFRCFPPSHCRFRKKHVLTPHWAKTSTNTTHSESTVISPHETLLNNNIKVVDIFFNTHSAKQFQRRAEFVSFIAAFVILTWIFAVISSCHF